MESNEKTQGLDNRGLIIKLVAQKFMTEALGYTTSDSNAILKGTEIIFPTSPTARSEKRPQVLTILFNTGEFSSTFRNNARPRNIMAGGKRFVVKIRPGNVASFAMKRDTLMKEGARLKKERKEEIDAWFDKIRRGDKNTGEKKFPLNYSIQLADGDMWLYASDTFNDKGGRDWKPVATLEDGTKTTDIRQ